MHSDGRALLCLRIGSVVLTAWQPTQTWVSDRHGRQILRDLPGTRHLLKKVDADWQALHSARWHGDQWIVKC